MRLIYFPGKAHNRANMAAPDDNPPTGFYTLAEAARLARVPKHRLYAWRREGIIAETIEAVGPDGSVERGYTFESLFYLRVLRMLRDKGVSLEDAVKVIQHLRERFGPPGEGWAGANIFGGGETVYADRNDSWGTTVATPTRRGQKLANELFGEEFEKLRQRADALFVPEELQPYVELDPAARSGSPIVRGTTIRTDLISNLRKDGTSYRTIQEYYPVLSIAQIKAAIRFENMLDAESEAA